MKKPSPYREPMDYLTRLVGKPLCYGIKSPDMVFATFENGEESWRYFTCNKDEPHLVASDLGLEFT